MLGIPSFLSLILSDCKWENQLEPREMDENLDNSNWNQLRLVAELDYPSYPVNQLEKKLESQ